MHISNIQWRGVAEGLNRVIFSLLKSFEDFLRNRRYVGADSAVAEIVGALVPRPALSLKVMNDS
jgi:hypothetical protein